MYLLGFVFILFGFLIILTHNKMIDVCYTWFLLFFFSILCGTRYETDADYATYVEIFHLVPSINEIFDIDLSSIHGESGFLISMSLFKYVGLYSGIFFLIVGFFSLLFKLKLYTAYTQYVFFCFAVYISLYFYRYEFIQIRMGLAIGIFALSLRYFIEDKIKLYFVLVLVSMSIHTSMFVALLLPLINRFDSKTVFKITIFSILVFPLFNIKDVLLLLSQGLNLSGIARTIVAYSSSEQYSNTVSLLQLGPLRRVLVFLFTYFAIKKVSENRESFYIFIKIWKIYCFGIVLSFLLFSVEIFYSRLSSIFDIVEPIIIAASISIIFERKHRPLALTIVLSFYVSLCYYSLENSESIYEYKTWLGQYF
ncbi:EpsG family protein [Vibrio owensii]|uniref:EpsG family protein n=1 Tax=Vibrio owensii TaxID=696485 RepID=UPI002F40EC06